MSAIWLPGSGLTDIAVLGVDRAVREYDESLTFGRNEDTGQWCIYKLMGPGNPPLPVLGFDEIPHPEDAIKKLWRADALRSGNEILDEINRHNAAIDAHYERAASEGEGIAAEGLEWGTRQMKGAEAHRIVSTARRSGNRMGGYS